MKVLMMKGLPGSGKSTSAKMLMNGPFKYKRVNRDELRLMIDNGKWSQDNEKLIRNIRDLIIVECLSAGQNVIIDDTNLDPSLEDHFKNLIASFKAEFEVVDFTNVDKDECIKRDLARPNSVGSKVINKMYNQYIAKKEIIIYDPNLPNAIMCDIDGTLALFGKANPYERDFTKDEVNKVVKELLDNNLDVDNETEEHNLFIILCSGRQEKFRKQTEQWLENNGIYYDFLFMRQTGDIRKDSIVKKEFYDNNIKSKFNVKFVLDDRDQVVQMWRNAGLTCLQVAEGDF